MAVRNLELVRRGIEIEIMTDLQILIMKILIHFRMICQYTNKCDIIKGCLGVAQLVARDFWEVEVAGSSPVTQTILHFTFCLGLAQPGSAHAWGA